MTTPLFLLRCLEIGLSSRDLDYLTIGMVMDIWTEKANDSVKYDNLATQEDFDIVRTYGYNKIKKISERRCFIWQQNQRISMLALSRK